MTLIARFMGPTWGPSGADRTQVGPMLASWTLLSCKCWPLSSQDTRCNWISYKTLCLLLEWCTWQSYPILKIKFVWQICVKFVMHILSTSTTDFLQDKGFYFCVFMDQGAIHCWKDISWLVCLLIALAVYVLSDASGKPHISPSIW